MKKSSRARITAIVPAAGKGARFKSKEKKIFAKLNGKPLLLHTLKLLQSSPVIEDIILVTDARLIERVRKLVKKYGITKVRHVVRGGRQRSDSVRNGLAYVKKDSRLVLIHDGARPLATGGIIERTVRAAERYGASVAAVPVKATIKVSGRSSFVRYTPDRKTLWEIQTPQVFRRDILVDAYKKAGRNNFFTDDAALVENIGKRIKIAKGGYGNIKITTIEDMKMAEALIKR